MSDRDNAIERLRVRVGAGVAGGSEHDMNAKTTALVAFISILGTAWLGGKLAGKLRI